MSNPSANDDDEWEKVELSLESMKLTEPKGVSKNTTPSAPRFNAAPVLSASEVNSNSGKFTPGSTGSAHTPVESSASGTEMVDSALVNALSNPRERMVVFQIENTILNFVKSSQDRTLDFPPQYNSFRRLIAYRIGQRFGLTHAQSEATNENGERGITLFKTPGYRIPSVLLIDLNIPVQQDGDSNESSNNYSEAGTLVAVPISTPSTSAAAAPPAKKFQVMKRAVPSKSESDSQKAGSGRREQLSSEDKERAYSEARARIFGEETPLSPSPSAGSSGTSNQAVTGTPTPAADETGASGVSSRQPTPVQQQQSSSSARSSNTSSPQPAAVIAGSADGIAAPVKRVTSDTQLSSNSVGSNNGGNRNNASPGTSSDNRRGGGVSANNWKGNKAQTRDLQAERVDPDFARSKTGGGGGPRGGYSNPPNSNSNYNQYNNQYANQSQQQQQQQYHHQQQQQQQQQYYYPHQMGYPPSGYVDPHLYNQTGPYGQPQQQQQQQQQHQAGLRLAPTLGEVSSAEQQYYQQQPWAVGPPSAGPYNMASGGLHHPPPGAAIPGGGGYYSVDPYSQQQQQQQQQLQAPPPPAPHMMAPQESFYDYSHLASNNKFNQQQQGQYQQQQYQQQQGRNRKAGGSQQPASFNATEFPPLG